MSVYDTNEQLIIIYTDPKSHAIKKYSTAYNKEQSEYYFARCLEKYGKEGSVRVVRAKELSPG